MFNLAVVLILQLKAPLALDSASVRGVIRSEPTGSGISGAMVEALDDGTSGSADTTGSYSLPLLAAGSHRLRFIARGYQPLILDVRVINGAPLGLDVTLVPIPTRLEAVRVMAPTPRLTGIEGPGAPVEPGRWSLSGDKIRQSTAFVEGDAFRLLATSPQVNMLPESPASVHVRGGSSDQNLFLLDGAPVFSPVHSGQQLSAFNPDIIDDLVVHGAAPSAQYGGQLSGIVDVRTSPTIPDRATARGEFSTTNARSSIDVPLIADRLGLSLSARHTYNGLRRENLAESSMPGTWFDAFGKLMLRGANSELTLSSFAADNGLGFPSLNGMSGLSGNNHFEWTTGTQALALRRALGNKQVEVLAWRAHFDAEAAWSSDSTSLGLSSAVRATGISAKFGVTQSRGQFSGGVEIQRLSSRYDISPTSVATSGANPSYLHLLSAPTIGSIFAEQRWRISGRWSARAGGRASFVSELTPNLEPRLSLGYDDGKRWEFSAGYARLHQYSQSLRGEESLLGTIVGPDFLVGAGDGGVPVASSHEYSASAALRVGGATRFGIDAFARHLKGVILPTAISPFAITGYSVGGGPAWGLSGHAETRVRDFSLNAVYSFSYVERGTDTVEFRPSFATRQSASLIAGYEPTPKLSFSSAMWLASGRPTTIIGDNIGWDNRDAVTTGQELTGSPQHAAGALDAARLPYFFRWDIGGRYTIAVGDTRSATFFAGVNNLFGRENKTGYIKAAGSARRDLTMLPASIVFGLDWSL